MTRVRWSESEQAEIGPRADAQYFIDYVHVHAPLGVRHCAQRTAVRVRIQFPANYHGPMETDTEWHEVPYEYRVDPRAEQTYLQRITSVFVGSGYEDEWRRGWL